MRLITTFTNEQEARTFHAFLQKNNVNSNLEGLGLWIVEEDDIAQTIEWLKDFQSNPDDPQFHDHSNSKPSKPSPQPTPPPSTPPPAPPIRFPKKSPPRRQQNGTGSITLLTLISCLVLFIWTWGQQALAPDKSDSPIEQALLFDYPKQMELRNQLNDRYGSQWIKDPQNLPPDGKLLLNNFYQAPTMWRGLYSTYIMRHRARELHQQPPPWFEKASLFEKIRQGEVWRLFAPCLLHGGIFHIFFNMAWLLMLGNQIESRLGSIRYLLFILITGILSSTAQYLMGGHAFLGFSGVVCAMLAFVWVRQREAPWEGYALQPGTITFVTLFVAALALFQVYAFYRELYSAQSFSSGIGNTAHISGAIFGGLLGHIPFFHWRQFTK